MSPPDITYDPSSDPAWLAALASDTTPPDGVGTDVAGLLERQLAQHRNGDHDGVLTPADRIRQALLSTEQLKSIPPPEPLIDGLLYRDTLAMAYGPSGAGKSFVAIDIAMHTPSKPHWHSLSIAGGQVLYVIAEGAAGVGLRTAAWEELHGPSVGVSWLPWAVNIFDGGWTAALAEVIAERRPALVVLDTFARSIVGADENSARDIGIAVEHLEQLRYAAASCILLVHHAGKDSTAGARGSSALRAAMNTEIEISGDPTRLRVKVTKQKDASELDAQWFKLSPAAESMVVEPIGLPGRDELPAGAFETLATLREIEVAGGVSVTAWRVAVTAPERTFYRHRAALVDHGLVINVGTDKTPRYQAKRDEEVNP